MTTLTTYLVILSDSRTDVPVPMAARAPQIWGYEVEAESAQPAVPKAIAQWHGEVGPREAISISVVAQEQP
jgi:hypothetical protein